jgi:hypothetical protein
VDGVAVDEDRAVGEGLAREPERVGVVPLLGSLVEHELESDAVSLLERRRPLLDPCRGEPRDDNHVADPDRAEVREGDVEDRAPVVEGKKRLRKGLRQRMEPPSGPGREHKASHSPSQPSGAIRRVLSRCSGGPCDHAVRRQ